jgi:hypothetical protein
MGISNFWHFRYFLLFLSLFVFLTYSSQAGGFKDTELQIDIYGVGNFNKSSRGNYVDNLSERLGGPEFGLRNQLSGRPAWGLGIGINKFFSRYIGVGVEQSTFGRDVGSRRLLDADFGYWRWQTSGALIVRYPLERLSLCPFLLVGGGGQYSMEPRISLSRYTGENTVYKLAGQGFGQVGGGLEYRLLNNTAIFSDLRYLFSGVQGLPRSQMQWRWGIRQAF